MRFPGFESVTRSVTQRAAVASTRTLTDIGVALAHAALGDHPDEREITLLAISVSNLVPECPLQLELPLDGGADEARAGTAAGTARRELERAIDAARARFGPDAVGYAPVVFRESGGVPDEFRELAQSETHSP